MDSVVAGRMEKELVGNAVGGWTIARRIGNGKSAVVFEATKAGVSGAVKIFERELVERYGAAAQRERVARERSLIGKHHPNLVEILDAGEDTEADYFFVVMELLPWKNLDDERLNVPFSKVPVILQQLASAAEFLEAQGYAHRDIKPENVAISPTFDVAKLLDLGVLRPVGLAKITDDEEQKRFVATLQYSPPELLVRDEQDDQEGWRAVTFYQLGGVLHDLLTKRKLFGEYSPFVRMAEAVRTIEPRVVAPDAHPDLIVLTENCLVKSPETRLKLVSWDSFRRPLSTNDAQAARVRIEQRRARIEAQDMAPAKPNVRERLKQLAEVIDAEIRAASIGVLPPVEIRNHVDAAAKHLCLAAAFSASPGLGVRIPFIVMIDATAIDVEANAFRIEYGAVVTISAPERCTQGYVERQMTVLYEGVVQLDALKVRVSDALVSMLDAVQSRNEEGAWMSLGGG